MLYNSFLVGLGSISEEEYTPVETKPGATSRDEGVDYLYFDCNFVCDFN